MAPTCYRAAAIVGRVMGVPRVCHLGFPPEPGEIARSFWSGPEALVGCFDGQTAPLQDQMRGLSPQCRVLDIPNGIDTIRFSPDPARRAAGRARLPAGDAPLVMIVGHLSAVKGYPVFLRAAAAVRELHPDCHFAALGGETVADGYLAHLQSEAGALGLGDRMHFLGWRDDVPEVIAAADIVVLPSWSEGLPLAVLEAMACGKPVVAAAIGGLTDTVLPGVTGELVPPRRPDLLAAELERLLSDELRLLRYGRAAVIRARTRYGWSRVARETERVYSQLLRGTASALSMAVTP
jgi:glycosyltransferase involved in cell wall biosynthesis